MAVKILLFWIGALGLLLFQDGTDGIVMIEDFETNQSGEFPEHWKGRKKKAKQFYRVADEVNNKYLEAHTKDSHMFVIKKAEVDIAQYPYLNWKWRPNIFPPDGDETVKKKCDVVASVNVVLVAVKWKPKTIKYSWSTTLPVGTRSRSPFSKWPARADIVVIRSGIGDQEGWITEKVNVLEDYKKLYKKESVESFEIGAIVLMSDSDNTGSESAADYDDIYFSRY